MRVWSSFHYMKNHIFFFQMFWKYGRVKKTALVMIFLVSPAKIIFLFLENLILFFRPQKKDDLSQKKNTWKWDIFFKYSEKTVFPKKLHWNMIFLVSSTKMAFLFRKYCMIVFPWTENERWSFSKHTWKYDVFCIFGKDGISFSYKYEIPPPILSWK